MENMEILITGAGILCGQIASIIVALTRLRSEKNRHSEVVNNQRTRNELALEQTIKLDSLQESFDLLFNMRSSSCIKNIKNNAYKAQKSFFITEMQKLLDSNNIANKQGKIQEIKDVVSKMITNTDNELLLFPVTGIIAPTQDKIQYIYETHLIEKAYNILVESTIPEKRRYLISKAGRLHDEGLGLILNKFYDQNWRTKKQEI